MGAAPGHRFCHVAVVSGDSMYVFGGYDGSSRLNDFLEFNFGVDLMSCDIPPSSLVTDLRAVVNSDVMSDVTFVVEGRPVYAHKVMCLRCSYFRAMLTVSFLVCKVLSFSGRTQLLEIKIIPRREVFVDSIRLRDP